MKSRVEEEREETSDSAFPGQEKGKWIQKTLEERNRETTFLGLLCLSPLCCFLSQLRTTHHNCTVFPPDPSIHPKAEERSQSAPDLSHPMPSNPSSLSTWTPPSSPQLPHLQPPCLVALASRAPVLCRVQEGNSSSD